MRRAMLAWALFAAGCSCGNEPPPQGGPCTKSDAPAACGQACSGTSPCPSGFYCTAEGCAADCLAQSDCSASQICVGGKCRARSDHDGTVSTGEGGADCPSVTVDTALETPNVILVVDRSGSMNVDFGGRSRWEALRRSLLAEDGLIRSLESVVRFGMVMYTHVPPDPVCPNLVEIPCSLDNYDEISSVYQSTELIANPSNPSQYVGGTPTGDSIRTLISHIATLAPDRSSPTILVLATDGEPDTCEDGDDEVNGRRESVEAVQAAFQMDIRTFVISVGTGIGESHLTNVANAGVGTSSGAMFWRANDTAGLEEALSTIIGSVTSCNLTLDGTIDVASACEGSVRFGSEAPLACGDDWRAVDANHIELLGDACDRLQRGEGPLTATFPCGTILD